MENGNRTASIASWGFTPGSLPFPLIIAHRGDATSAPENTIPAFKKALNLGADGIELDVRLTKDRELVVFHDRVLGRTAAGSGPVNHTPKTRCGSWTLAPGLVLDSKVNGFPR